MKIICDQGRICDVEDSIRYWNQTTDHIEDFLTKREKAHLEVIKVFQNESDHQYSKIILRAIQPTFESDQSIIGHNSKLQFDKKFSLSILPKNMAIVNEIRKRGVVQDREASEFEMQIRVGDTLVLYETKHIPQDLQLTTNLGYKDEFNKKR